MDIFALREEIINDPLGRGNELGLGHVKIGHVEMARGV